MGKKKRWGDSVTISALKKHRRIYFDMWDKSSKSSYDNDYYLWMNQHIKEKEKIFEIGVGAGYSTLSLLRNGHTVISVDENKECLKATYSLLLKEGYNIIYIERENIKAVGNSCYEIEYNPIEIESDDYDAILIEGDIVNDNNLIKWLEQSHRFDAILCWLIGTHSYMFKNNGLCDYKLRDLAEYRGCVQEQIALVGKKVLKSNGVYQIVDRVVKKNLKYMEDDETKEFYEEVVTHGMSRISINTIKYENTVTENGIIYGMYDKMDKAYSITEENDIFLVSQVFLCEK